MSLWTSIRDGLTGSLGSILGATGNPVLGAFGSAISSATSAVAQTKLNKKTMEFNAKEAEKARAWSAQQNLLNQQFNADEALKQRTFSAEQAALANSFSAEQAQIQRDYLTEMSNTEHQRAVNDLRAAGLNPILAATNGNSVSGAGTASAVGIPSSSAASISNAPSSAASVAPMRIANMADFMNSAANLQRANNDSLRVDNETKKTHQDIAESISRIKLNDETISKIKAETGNIKKQASLIDNQILESIGKQNLTREEIKAVRKGVENQTIIANSTASLNYWKGVEAQSHSAEARERIKTYEGKIAHAKKEANAYQGTGSTAWYYFNAAASKVASLLK